jgi:hypothetical protein
MLLGGLQAYRHKVSINGVDPEVEPVAGLNGV